MWQLPAAVLCALCLAAAARAGDEPPRPRDLTEISLEELANVEVTSAGRREQRLSETTAALFVVTREDVRRSGATTLAEALRLVPGMNVAQIGASEWAVSPRGFLDRFANKLLVLVDGRSVYTPLFSGVYWEVQDVLLADLERIEVIRGPGAALWGANAVNGVVNVVTRHSAATESGLLEAGAGTEERYFGAARYGRRLGGSGHGRVWAKYASRDDLADARGEDAFDAWTMARGGLRLDFDLPHAHAVSVSAELYDGDVRDAAEVATLLPPFTRTLLREGDVDGGHVLARWAHTLAGGSQLQLQASYDRTHRSDAVHREVRDTGDVDFQHSVRLGGRHEVVWGLGYRHMRDDITGAELGRMTPPRRRDDLFSAFVQDDVAVVKDRLRVTVGSKLEHNDYTGFEVQPSARLLWTPRPRQAVWAAVSRAVRTPSRFEHDIDAAFQVVPGLAPVPALVTLRGSRAYQSEQLVAFEAGYRLQAGPSASLDLAAFHNRYDGLRSLEPAPPFFTAEPPPPHLVLPIVPANLLSGTASGLEVAASVRPLPRWRVSVAYSFLDVELELEEGSGDTLSTAAGDNSPAHQVHLRSLVDLPRGLELDASLFAVTEIDAGGRVPGYGRVDTRLGWSPRPSLELALVGQNLLRRRHPEFGPGFLVVPSQPQRSVYVKATWRF